jgi:GntR family transcriptional regulator
MEFKGNKAIFVQIADMMLEKIVSKSWPEGERIPSVRELAIQVEVNPNTAMRAYTYLQGEDVIQNKRGVGYFVTVNATSKALKLKRAEFESEYLPYLINQARILGITKDELAELISKNY